MPLPPPSSGTIGEGPGTVAYGSAIWLEAVWCGVMLLRNHTQRKRRTDMRKTLSVFALVLSVPGTHLLLAHNSMSFFITSKGTGDGANLGGLAGADRHCQSLAAAVGAGN